MGLLNFDKINNGQAIKKSLVIDKQYQESAGFLDMFSFHGTAAQMVFKNLTIYILIGIHYFMWFVRYFHCELPAGWNPDAEPPVLHPDDRCASGQYAMRDVLRTKWTLNIGDIGPLSGLTTFLVVFYNGNCFGRYNTMYSDCVAIQGKLHNMSLYLRTYFSKAGTRWSVIRYPLASHFIFYWSLQKRYLDWEKTSVSGAKWVDDWPKTLDELIVKHLIPRGVLIPAEKSALIQYKGNKHKLLFTWCVIALKRNMQRPVEEGGEAGNVMMGSQTEQTALISSLKEEIVGMRGAIGKIDNSLLFPIPYQYFHVVNVVLKSNLLLLAYAFLFIDVRKDNPNGSPWSLICYPLICFTLCGLLEVANAMSDPFASQTCGFNIAAVCNNVYNDCKKLCEEPEEDFLQEIGDPKCNPVRNTDGTLGSAENLDEALLQEVMWPESDVAALVAEKQEVEEKLRKHQLTKLEASVKDLSVTMVSLLTLQQETSLANEGLVQGVESLKQAVDKQTSQVNRLEDLTTKQMSRISRLERLHANKIIASIPVVKATLPPFGLALEMRNRGGQIVCCVAEILRGSPAEQGGLLPGDEIVSVVGISNPKIAPGNVKDLLASLGWDDTITFHVNRAMCPTNEVARETLTMWRGGHIDGDGVFRGPPLLAHSSQTVTVTQSVTQSLAQTPAASKSRSGTPALLATRFSSPAPASTDVVVVSKPPSPRTPAQ